MNIETIIHDFIADLVIKNGSSYVEHKPGCVPYDVTVNVDDESTSGDYSEMGYSEYPSPRTTVYAEGCSCMTEDERDYQGLSWTHYGYLSELLEPALAKAREERSERRREADRVVEQPVSTQAPATRPVSTREEALANLAHEYGINIPARTQEQRDADQREAEQALVDARARLDVTHASQNFRRGW